MNPYKLKSWLWFIIFCMFCLIFVLSGCSTVDGMGKDISSTAQWTKEKMGGSK